LSKTAEQLSSAPMTDSPEISEIASLLAAALQRLSERKSSQLSSGEPETLLDCGMPFEGHVQQKCEDVDP